MERNRISTDVKTDDTENSVKESLAQWISCHHRHLNDEDLRLLANVVIKDFISMPKVVPKHMLISSGICEECIKRGISFKDFPKAYIEWANDILEQRPKPLQKYDQAPVNSYNAFLNIAYLLSNISNESNMAFLGDDDFHSLLLAKILPKLKITVFDVDIRIVSLINKIAERESLSVTAIKTDICNEVDDIHNSKFDVFYSDPPYSKSGIMLFLYRGIMLLKNKRNSWGVLALPFTVLPLAVREMLLEIQEYLIKCGFFIEESIPYFKNSVNPLGIISGIMKFQRIFINDIILPEEVGDIYEHFYD